MHLEFYHYAIALSGAFLAGCINTLAGSGSVITLSILTEVLGLPATMANGTNRVGILAQSITGTYEFAKGGKLYIRRNLKYIIPILVGAVFGVLVAANVSNQQFRSVFKFLMILMLFVVLFKPSRWIQPTNEKSNLPFWAIIPIFWGLGFYAGFIQMGMGIFFLAIMVLLAKVNIMESNAVKTLVVGILTIIAIIIFQLKGLIDWKMGGIMAIGQALGGWLTARYAVRFKQADKVAYWLLIVIVVGSVISLFWRN